MKYFFVLVVSALVTWLITPVVRKMAARLRVLDVPNAARKVHALPIPLLGGMAIFAGLMVVLWYVALTTPLLLNNSIKFKHLVGFTLGGLVLMIGGYLDDRYRLKPSRQILFPILAAFIVIASGIGVRMITNPLGGTISLVFWEKVLFWFQGVGYRITLPADILTFLWLMGMMYTTKLLDGLDGLVTGLTSIGGIMVLLFTTMTLWYQPEVGMLAAISAGAFLGFLPWNFHPAKMFLGEGGSLFAGFLLGTLAIISGGKIAIALLVLGIPVLDAARVIIQRVVWEKRSPTVADRSHLHFRLLDIGLSHRGTVFLFWTMGTLFGIVALFLQSRQKIIALGVLAAIVVILAGWAMMRSRVRIVKDVK